MSENIKTLPFELLEIIFSLSDGATVAKCREVCKTWKEFIDENDRLWRLICLKDFKYSSKIARRKSGSELLWKYTYRNLMSWPRIAERPNRMRRLYSFSTHDANHVLEIDHGLLVLREKDRMVLYDMITLRNLPVCIPEPHCSQIANCDCATAIRTRSGLYIQRNTEHSVSEAWFDADNFVLTDSELFFYKSKDVFKVNLKGSELKAELLFRSEYNLSEIGYNNGYLFLFNSFHGKILTYLLKEKRIFEKTMECPERWVQNIRTIRALDSKNVIGYSRNVFFIETEQYKHLSLDFPPITALFFYGDIILIGTTAGEILLYRLSDQLPHTKPKFTVIYKMPCGTFAVSLDVYERKSGPVIVAATYLQIILFEVDFFYVENNVIDTTVLPSKVCQYKRLLRLKERLRKQKEMDFIKNN